MKKQQYLSLWQWCVVLGATAAAVAITEKIGIVQAWQDIIVFTSLLFATVIVILRPYWKSPYFWIGLLLILIVHLWSANLILDSFPPGRFGLPSVLMGGVSFVEALVILGGLSKVMTKLGISRDVR